MASNTANMDCRRRRMMLLYQTHLNDHVFHSTPIADLHHTIKIAFGWLTSIFTAL
jgi:hypothetical protein